VDALTLRGRCFLGAGLAAVLCGIQLGQDDFVRIGLLVLVVPLAAWVVVRLRDPRPRVVRDLGDRRVEAGATAPVDLELEAGGPRGGSRGRLPALLVQDQLPAALGVARRFWVPPLSAGEQVRMTYVVRTSRRGRYPVGPVQLRRGDPLGMVEVATTLGSTDSLLVTPRTEPLPVVPLSGRLTGAGDQRAREVLGGGSPDVTTREYRVGDDLRRIHWPTSARTDTLMVRREEQDWQLRCTLLLDDRRFSHRSGRGGTFEAAVSATASLVRHLGARGYAVHLATAAGLHPRTEDLLEQLALVSPSPEHHLDLGWVRTAHHGGLLVAVLGRLEGDDRDRVTRLGAAADAAYAVVHDLGDGDSEALTTHLRRAGWQAGTRIPSEPLAPVWQGLGR